MYHKMKLTFCVLLTVLVMSACGSLQQSTVSFVPSSTATIIPTLKSTATTISTPVPIATSASSATIIPVPSATTKPTAGSIVPFRGVASLAGLLDDSTGEVQLHVLANDSIWIISSQSAIHWDGQEWKIVLPETAGQLVSLDNKGELWVLPQDTSEISAWHDGKWTTYSADSGWKDAGYFEKNWWAPAPWGVVRSADGTLWVPMAQDVRSFDGDTWSSYTLEDMGFPTPEMEDFSIVHDLAIADGGAEVWVGECYYSGPGPMGGGGVRWYDGQAWRGADAPVGKKCVSALAVDPAGDMWLGVPDAIWRYEHTSRSWTEYSLPEGLLSGYNFTHPRQLIIDEAGDIWVIMQMCGGASCDGGANLYRIHDEEWSLIIDAAYWSSSFKQLVLDGNGQGWLFWEGMFYQLDDTTLKPITSITVLGVDMSPDGAIWVVAGSGENASLQVLEP
jgi:hypothetical protein